MRALRQYINEISNISSLKKYICEGEDITKDNVEATWNGPSKLYVEAPITYSESDVQIYLDDMMLDKMPGSNNKSQALFGSNHNNIADVYFEYDSMVEAIGVKQKPDIEWDSRYDTNNVDDTTEMHILCIENLRYIISFESFKLVNVSDDQVDFELIKIFNAANSSNTNVYPIKITFDNESLEYDGKEQQ